jgi:tellurite resistance protein TehA-like permease
VGASRLSLWPQTTLSDAQNIFTVNLGTGAVSLLLANTFEWSGQRALGTIFFVLNLVIYIVNCTVTALRAYLHWPAFQKSFSNPAEALFAPTALLGGATLFVGTISYGVPYTGFWLVRTLYVVWFVYIALSAGLAGLLQWTLYDQTRDLISVTPAECLPVFPLMLSGTLGAALSFELPDDEAVYVVILSYILQARRLIWTQDAAAHALRRAAAT